jgi:hypothetical protein
MALVYASMFSVGTIWAPIFLLLAIPLALSAMKPMVRIEIGRLKWGGYIRR